MMKTLISPMLLALVVLVGCGSDEKSKNACPEGTPATCFNGVIDPGEQCDPGDGKNLYDFGTNTCQSLGMGGGQLKCGCCELQTDLCTGISAQQQFQTGGGAGG